MSLIHTFLVSVDNNSRAEKKERLVRGMEHLVMYAVIFEMGLQKVGREIGERGM